MVPGTVSEITTWFVEALGAEIAELERNAGEQRHELHRGRAVKRLNESDAILEFEIAGGNIRVPDDSNGKLKTKTEEFAAVVVSQSADVIRLRLSGANVPDEIPRAELVIDEIGLLRRLVEVLSNPAEHGFSFGELPLRVFHPATAEVGSDDLPESIRQEDLGEKRAVIQQALGSEVTFIWGPPGTGKTFAIARLITAHIERDERVLVTSHTKAAVDQALFEAVKDGAPLAKHCALTEGHILRLGEVPHGSKLQDSVLLNSVLERKGSELRERLHKLEVEAKPFRERDENGQRALAAWSNLSQLEAQRREIERKLSEAATQVGEQQLRLVDAQNQLVERHSELEKAQRAWFGRTQKVERATIAVSAAEDLRDRAGHSVAQWKRYAAELQNNLQEKLSVIDRQQAICDRLPARLIIEQELARVREQIETIDAERARLQAKLHQLEQEVINGAKAIFCTLTKNYMGESLKGQRFTAVIVDEISMALPPLIFLAAARASSRVILVGDFMQLPPIVRSKEKIAKERLGTDTFHLACIAKDGKPVRSAQVLTRLKTQHRMRPEIASVARELAYKGDLTDSDEVRTRDSPPWLSVLSSSRLLIVDTADLNSWCGREVGSLSRFNFNSATVSVDLAALAAAAIKQPADDSEKPIGIVTPYAAQRRLLKRLVDAADLAKWVQVGTVYTFQGGEAELIIFDSVLDEPYWSSRLTNPRALLEVKRDLNVAVTRAREKFVVVGCSEWLSAHAKTTSALGMLWHYMIEHAECVSALDLVNAEFFGRVVNAANSTMGWSPPCDQRGPTFEKLDETNFFPRFTADIRAAEKTLFGLAPFFGEYRWPQVQPAFAEVLKRGVEVTILTPPPAEAQNPSYVEKVIENLRSLGAVVVFTSGLHGKDVIIDERIVYTGSMNWSSNRGRLEEIHRIDSPDYAQICLNSIQARHIRSATRRENSSLRTCPRCGSPLQVVNQRDLREWEHQPLKIGCTNKDCPGYLRPIDERAPFSEVPRCSVDRKTKYRLAERGKGKVWLCPKHPAKCPRFKFVPGDGELGVAERHLRHGALWHHSE